MKPAAASLLTALVMSPGAPSPESVATPSIMPLVKSVIESMWPGVPLVPDMDAGASDSKHTRGAGITTYGIGGLFTDIADNRAHGRDERIPLDGYYENLEVTYRLM